jgi:hypothetical protein
MSIFRSYAAMRDATKLAAIVCREIDQPTSRVKPDGWYPMERRHGSVPLVSNAKRSMYNGESSIELASQ